MLSDPALNTQQLTEQLRSLGLYAAPTLGDGNCLFRALSDQYYGSSSLHLKLREEICDWMAAHKERYEPFVEDERGLDVHLRCMRQQGASPHGFQFYAARLNPCLGTYGGHLELSAFAHLKRRNVKVIQPGLVYVIEWSTGGDLPPSSPIIPVVQELEVDDLTLSERDRRRMRREKKREKPKVPPLSADEGDEDITPGAVYVAYVPLFSAFYPLSFLGSYHDWEHFSSVRNLIGPHAGLPHVVEKSTPSETATPLSSKHKPSSKASKRPTTDAVHISLPPSRSTSPTPSSEASGSGSSLSLPPSSSASARAPSSLPNLALRMDRSPKRTFDESSAESRAEMSQGNAKRTRGARRMADNVVINIDVDVDPDADTPSLSASGSSAEEESSSSVSSPAPTPPPPPEDKPLTRRQRKVLGLPKPRPTARTPKGVVGKIVIPGGRYRKNTKTGVLEEAEDDEDVQDTWKSNGSGRLDVRGFRELKI